MAGLKGFGSFRHFIFGHKTQLIFIYLFFAGFLATGLAYAAITGQHEHFGTANYKPGAQLMIVNATVPGAEPGDLAEIGDHGKTLSFHLNFDEVNAPKVVTFCLHNGAKIDYQLGFPAVVNPDDPSVVVEWPKMDHKVIPAGTVSCDPEFRIRVYYSKATLTDMFAEMHMRINYVQN